ncbi:MAG: 16S rRNA (guanine(527)-N(7))-methyltransferase RsmG [Acutalibacteraceae bacterium]|nr:16S rRNA (guanine(527)-N(7))-methyltransferase RsmG [Acutalibacteraceae bacterium]
MSIIDILKEHCSDYGIEFNQDLAEKLEIYGRLLKEWNDKINLTAIKDDEGIAVKHFLDCLLVSKVADFKNGMKVIDVGTGAGFPGLVIAAAYPDVNVTLLDSTGKKLKAVENIAEEMGVKNVQIVHSRAEDAGKNPEFREKYDFATARAVAELRVLLEYTLPFVKKDGYFLSLKGATAKEEIDGAGNSLNTLGGKIDSINDFTLPGGDKRAIIKVKKISQTSPKYPRPSAQIAKKPL